ncbi:unnamed protein product [Ascophyllum nodosum]
MSFIYDFPSTITILGFDIPFLYVAGAATALVILLCGCCFCGCCRKKTKIVASEKFRWPSSSKFLKKTDPGHPPKLIVDKYDAELRRDRLPEDRESFWIAKYQPNGERDEVRNQMYLRWKDGVVFGVGFEKVRQLCKIKGEYKYNRVSNQTVVAMTCKFSNELDKVMFHGCANGTSFMGNCYMHEIDRFSLLSNVPGLRQASACKFKGSFLLQKMEGMGDPSLRVRLHSRRVHKWAGDRYPDDTVSPPTSPLYALNERRPDEGYDPVDGDAASRRKPYGGGSTSSRSSRSSRSRPKVRVKRALSRLNPFSRRKRRHFDFGETALTPTDVRAEEREFPPWVQKGADYDDDQEEDEDPYSGVLSRGRLPISPGRTPRGIATLSPNDKINYLEIDGIPGRSGPAMV